MYIRFAHMLQTYKHKFMHITTSPDEKVATNIKDHIISLSISDL